MAFGWSLVMLAHVVVLIYIEASVTDLGLPATTTSLTLFLLGIGGIVGTLLIGRISSRSLFVALIAAPGPLPPGSPS